MKELHGAASETVGTPIEQCYELLLAVDRYPDWYPDVVREAEVVERDPDGTPTKARATLHVSAGPLVRDFRLLLAVVAQRPTRVRLARIPHDSSDDEEFQVTWRLHGDGQTRIELELDANLSVPRLVPLGGIGESLARGFVTAAANELR